MNAPRLPLADTQLSEPVIEAALEALRSNWLTMGPRTQELEREFAASLGVEHAVAVSSGSAGLHLACSAAGVGPGDEVIVPALGFAADGHAAHWCGGTSVFADVESLERPLLDVGAVEALITPRTKAILAVHMFGYDVDLSDLQALCDDRGLKLFEDCCEAAGATHAGGAPVGSTSFAGCFSFFAKTQLPVGEGGIVATNDADTADRIRLLRSHAMTSVTWDRHRGHAETYDVTDLGYNYRLDEPRAAMARAHLAQLGGKVEALGGIVGAYRECLEGIAGVQVPFSDEAVTRAGHFAFTVVLADRATRDRVRSTLAERGIQSTFYPSMTSLDIFTRAGREHPCPRAEEFGERHLALPLATSMSAEDIELACTELEAAIDA